MSFEEEYRKRLRRLCNVTDDNQLVEVETETRNDGCCEMCRSTYTAFVVTVWAKTKGKYSLNKAGSQEFDSFMALEQALMDVEL